jgi:hypothetical protein
MRPEDLAEIEAVLASMRGALTELNAADDAELARLEAALGVKLRRWIERLEAALLPPPQSTRR